MPRAIGPLLHFNNRRITLTLLLSLVRFQRHVTVALAPDERDRQTYVVIPLFCFLFLHLKNLFTLNSGMGKEKTSGS